jgi:hypothetical protein
MDEARVGQKGRLCHRWWLQGPAPAGALRQALRVGLPLRRRRAGDRGGRRPGPA